MKKKRNKQAEKVTSESIEFKEVKEGICVFRNRVYESGKTKDEIIATISCTRVVTEYTNFLEEDKLSEEETLQISFYANFVDNPLLSPILFYVDYTRFKSFMAYAMTNLKSGFRIHIATLYNEFIRNNAALVDEMATKDGSILWKKDLLLSKIMDMDGISKTPISILARKGVYVTQNDLLQLVDIEPSTNRSDASTTE